MTVVITNSRERTRFFRFATVGIVGAFVDFGTFNLLAGLIGMVAVWASVLSFAAAIVNNFLWNRFWTYPDSRTKTPTRQLIQFTIISVIGLTIRTPLFAFLDVRLGTIFAVLPIPYVAFINAEFLGHNMALAIAVIVVMFWNFFANRYWTYNDVD